MNNLHIGAKLRRGAPNHLDKMHAVPLLHQEHD